MNLRKGSATLYYPVWHLEVEDMLVLKNNKGTENTRARDVDYAVQLNKHFYEKARSKENNDYYLFSPSDVPGLYEAFFADQEAFVELYNQYVTDETIRKKKVSAKELFTQICIERMSTGRIYVNNVDIMNINTPFIPEKAPIYSSNLCVHGKTKILTKDHGYRYIEELAGTTQVIWNGFEWSEVYVDLTNTDAEFVSITTNNLRELTCTPYHKFYVVKKYGQDPVEVRAIDLKEGDKLIKGEWPVIEGNEELANPYTQGFASGDGCEVSSNSTRLDLYGKKKELLPFFTGNISTIRTQKTSNMAGDDRIEIRVLGLRSKWFVPDNRYTVRSRLNWLAGYLDADGSVYRNGETEALTCSSTNLMFLQELREMLEMTGVTAKITNGQPEGFRTLPDGKGGYREYYCQQAWRLIISAGHSQKLLELGLNLHRLKIEKRDVQREAVQFERIESLIPLGDDMRDYSYCFNEPKRHLGVFNGLVTGQCNEIALPTKPLQTPEKDSEGEIALCTLSAINCYKFYDEQGKLNHVDLEETCTSAVRSLDALLSYQDYPVEQAREGALKRRSLGISTTNLAGLAAKLKLRYESPEFLNKLDEWMEALAYYCLKASNQLAKEKGKAEWLEDTTWQKGILPQDRANERARSLVTRERTLDWEALRKEIVDFGLRNSTLLTQAPIEASSLVTHSTNGIEPPRALLSIKANKDGATKQLVPDYELYKDFYTTMWSLQNNDATLNISAVMQMWIDQAISTNLNYDPAKYPNRQIPVAQMMKDILKAYSLGIKTIYYCNIRDGQKESNVLESMGCDGGACAI